MPALSGSAVERLTWHYEHPFAQAIEKAREGMPVAGVTSGAVPRELLRAAGYFPLVLNPPRGPFPLASEFMEEGVFGSRIRGIFDGIVSGAWPFLTMLVIPRTSEQEHKLFLYLREAMRQGIANSCPQLYLYNLLLARSPEGERYGLDRTRALLEYLRQNAGRAVESADLARAVEESGQVSHAIQAVLDLRRGTEPRLSGAEAMALIGAAYFMDGAEYARLAYEAAAELSRRHPLKRARILVKGSPLHHNWLHRAIESHGALVVAEDDWWGARSIRSPIATNGDVLRSIFEAYYLDASGPRVYPREIADEWFESAAASVDGVVFYLPPEDDSLGWDYPRWKEALDRRGVRSLLMREDAADELSRECHESIDAFVSRVTAGS